MRYEAREHKMYESADWTTWGVYDTEKKAWPALTRGRKVTNMGTREEAERDAAWLNGAVA